MLHGLINTLIIRRFGRFSRKLEITITSSRFHVAGLPIYICKIVFNIG